jgi:predicted ATPase
LTRWLGPDTQFNPLQSVLAQIRDYEEFPEVTCLGRLFPELRVYANWDLRQTGPLRRAQQTDLPSGFLLEDGSNLALVVSYLEHKGLGHALTEHLRKAHAPTQDITEWVLGGTIMVYLQEAGLAHPVPATRLSDGTLRYLCLLAILLHPEPPPLVCIEEPEIGLHPDTIVSLAELLKDAATRTQLIVTTHSDILVSALSDTPEAVLVCERDEKGTHLRRLEAEPLQEWLKEYSLGDIWRMGEIGGNRW